MIELGGAAAFDYSDGGTILSLRPSAGWFVVDNLELSAILEIQWADPDGGDSVTTLGAFVEPSFHLPFTNRLLGFLGIGAGLAYNNSDVGFALRPRLGLDILIGRSGILRPALDLTWSTADVVSRNGTTVVGVNTTFGLSIGYHVML